MYLFIHIHIGVYIYIYVRVIGCVCTVIDQFRIKVGLLYVCLQTLEPLKGKHMDQQPLYCI